MAGYLLRTAGGRAFVVGVEVFSAAKSTLGVLGIGHADKGGVTELEAVLTQCVSVGRVHPFGLTAFVEDSPICFFGGAGAADCNGGLKGEGGGDGGEGALGLGGFAVFSVSEEADFQWGGHGVGLDLGGEACKECIFMLFLR